MQIFISACLLIITIQSCRAFVVFTASSRSVDRTVISCPAATNDAAAQAPLEDDENEDTFVPPVPDVRLQGWRATPSSSDGNDNGDVDSEEVKSKSPPPSTDLSVLVVGDVVEFPLPQERRAGPSDTRTHGVAVLVSINRERGDASKLREDVLDRCEIQILRPAAEDDDINGGGVGFPSYDGIPDVGSYFKDGNDGGVWLRDELESAAYVEYDELQKIPSVANEGMDIWRRWRLLRSPRPEAINDEDLEWEWEAL